MNFEQENSNEEMSLPSDPKVRQQIKDCVIEAAGIQSQMDSYREALKEIRERVAKELGTPKRTFNRMVKTFHKQNYAAVAQDDEVFQIFYENIIESKNS